ncbi:MAG: glutaminyl-peptide cyclotransferase [Gammaproteobacteria bacterium]|nr:glutaminyl-peptide cyclotransferase [Gammaproteobacteria bacterium]
MPSLASKCLPGALFLAAGLCAGGEPVEIGYRVVQSFPHDRDAMTQGLVVHRGELFESTGGYGTSSVRRVDLRSGRVLRESRLADELFGEGLAAVGDALYQLTWRAGLGLTYDSETLAPSGQFTYGGEGWGLAWDGTHFIMSDGSAFLRYLDRETLRETHRIQVRDGDQPIVALNELELVEGHLFANVWNTTRIAVIDPDSGQVRGWLNLEQILPTPFRTESVGVLNGIAYDPDQGRLFVTGKRWPRLFEIELIPPIGELAD